MEIKLWGKYLNRFGDFVRPVYLVQEGTIPYQEGYRFKDSNGHCYTPSGRYNREEESALDLVAEMTTPTLDQIPYDNIKIGDRVLSFLNKPGKVIGKTPDTKSLSGTDPDYQVITMQWDGVTQLSSVSLSSGDSVRYLEKERPPELSFD